MEVFDINNFVGDRGADKVIDMGPAVQEEESIDPPKRKRGRPRKVKEEVATVNPATVVPQTSMSYVQENIPYATAYQETTQQLNESIAQLNILGAEVMNELQTVRSNKTLRNKYNYINDMTANVTSIINAKITAIREKNKTINDINHLELSRLKELKSTANQEDDNTRIQNMYDAFVNTPVGMNMGGGNPANMLGPSAQDMVIQNMAAVPLGAPSMDQAMWESQQDPAMQRMILGAKGAIDTVVMFDEQSGNRWFEVIDKATGQPMPNVEKPSNANIYDLDINIRGGFAKDSNRNTTYPLVVINGGDKSIMDY